MPVAARVGAMGDAEEKTIPIRNDRRLCYPDRFLALLHFHLRAKSKVRVWYTAATGGLGDAPLAGKVRLKNRLNVKLKNIDWRSD